MRSSGGRSDRVLIRVRVGVAVATTALLSSCTHTVNLPEVTDAGPCDFEVEDTRPEPGYLVSGNIEMELKPPLTESLKSSVCAMASGHDLETVSYRVDSFECTVRGFAVLTYIVDVRGEMHRQNGSTKALRASEKRETAASYVPSQCEALAEKAIQSLSDRIVGAL